MEAAGEALERAREIVDGARRVLFLTGAGVSAESGVPTFRQAGVVPEGDGPQPLWSRSRPEELATPGAFARDPVLVWFGEGIDPAVLRAAWSAAEAADLVIVAGTSRVVEPAASLARVTRRRGGQAIEINPRPTPLTSLATVSLRAPAGDGLPYLLDPA